MDFVIDLGKKCFGSLTPSSVVMLVININVVLYSMANWIVGPVIPFLSKRFGADPVMFGYLQSAAGLAQLVGGPFLGKRHLTCSHL